MKHDPICGWLTCGTGEEVRSSLQDYTESMFYKAYKENEYPKVPVSDILLSGRSAG
jgi:hypothetical protein